MKQLGPDISAGPRSYDIVGQGTSESPRTYLRESRLPSVQPVQSVHNDPRTDNSFVYLGDTSSNLAHVQEYLKAPTHQSLHPMARYPHNSQPYSRGYSWQEGMMFPPDRMLEVFMDEFLIAIHPGMPILETTHFALSPLLLQSITLSAMHFSKHPEIGSEAAFRRKLKSVCFYRAQSLLHCSSPGSNITKIQVFLLMTWHSDSTENGSSNAYYWIGPACRMAFDLGLHRNVQHGAMRKSLKRARRRIWWTLVVYDICVSLLYGRPRAIDLSESDTGNLNYDDFLDDNDSPIPSVNPYFSIQLSRLGQILSECYNELFSAPARRQASDMKFKEAVYSLTQWYSELTILNDDPQCDFWTANLHLLYHTFVILLHRQRMQDEASLAVAFPSLEKMIGILEYLHRIDALTCCPFYVNLSVFTGLTESLINCRSDNAILGTRARNDFRSLIQIVYELKGLWAISSALYDFFHTFSQRDAGTLDGPETNDALSDYASFDRLVFAFSGMSDDDTSQGLQGIMKDENWMHQSI